MSPLEKLVKRSTSLYSLPDVYFRLKAVLDDPNSAMADVAAVIGQDPALTARLLRLANSAYFGNSRKIDSVSTAVSLVGTRQIHDLALATAVTDTFMGITNNIVGMHTFWRNSVFTATLARQLAHRCNVLDAERLFVAGLLADIGHLLMYQHDPVRTIQALAGANGAGEPLWQVERAIFGYDYAQVGAALFASWQLPPGLLETTRYHVTPSEAQQFPLETAIVHVAKGLTNVASAGSTIARETQPRLDLDALELIQLDLQDLESVSQEAARKSSEVLELIFPSARKAS
ncbi:MAG: hypothetical protein AMJ69_00925 [Gammaproteobacteria bacterium SG8_47]|nr:MAG: hypothetical protein AMJ69_00925 [Gammaproteobacteria bacterium SG8_47]